MEGTVSRKKVFTEEKLEELSRMLTRGDSINSIALHFKVDRTTIRYQEKRLAGTLSGEEMEKRRQRAYNYKYNLRFRKIKPDHCKRCEILLEYAREGRNEDYCGECLNELGIL